MILPLLEVTTPNLLRYLIYSGLVHPISESKQTLEYTVDYTAGGSLQQIKQLRGTCGSDVFGLGLYTSITL